MAKGTETAIVKHLAASIAGALLAVTSAAASIIEGYPDIVICRAGDTRTIGYLHRVMDDGSAVYMALGGEFATVTPDRILHRQGAADCNGKTLEELIDDGQTRETHGAGE